MIAGAPVFWKCGKQSFTRTSTAETELLEAMNAMTTLRSIKVILHEMTGGAVIGMRLLVDNAAAVQIAS